MKILLTAAGYQGGYTLVQYFKKGIGRYSKDNTIIGTDMNENSAAQKYCDKFYPVPPGRSDDFIPLIEWIVEKEKIDVILPASSFDVLSLALNKKRFKDLGAIVIAADPKWIKIALNKHKTYQKLEGKIPLPQYICSSGIVIKPEEEKGSRGVEILEGKFAMEKLEGEHLDVDILVHKGQLGSCFVKTRERSYGGTIMEGKLVKRPKIVKLVEEIIKVLPLEYISVLQFIDERLIEINPRIPGSFIGEGWYLPHEAIRLGLMERDRFKSETLSERRSTNFPKPDIGTRIARYMHQYEL